MAERGSALAHMPMSESQGHGRATLQEFQQGSILQVGAWPNTLPTVRAALGEMLGLEIPAVGDAASSADVTVAAIAPGRYLVAGTASDLAERLEAALPAADGAVTDLLHGRVILRLSGEASRVVLAKCVAVDLHPDAFRIGGVAQTAIHHVDVVLIRSGEQQFDLWVSRSFAEALAEWLLDAGANLGTALRAQSGTQAMASVSPLTGT